ncbi:transposase (fragment) [Paraburkholderia piptadeniae]|uniref:Transposase n=1 Tax=Paraburkholderia piptadeniae TaxID=1701573 RepID=A0A1N7SXI3_9BURK
MACVRRYLRNLEELIAERGISVDHSTAHCWVLKLLPTRGEAFHRHERPRRQDLTRR